VKAVHIWGVSRALGRGSARGLPVLAALASLSVCGVAVPGAAAAVATGPVAGAARVGSAPGAARITVALPLRADLAGLRAFATEVTTPGSPLYDHYQPIPALVRRFGASAGERALVTRWLHRAGATAVGVDGTGLFARATLTAARAQRLFGTRLDEFRAAGTGVFMAPIARPSVPRGLRGAVTGVVGLDTEPLVQAPQAAVAPDVVPWALRRPLTVASPASGYTPRSGTPSGCAAATTAANQVGFTPNQYLTAYGYTQIQQTGLEGQGERVALIEIDSFKPGDLRAFAQCFGLATPPVKAFLVDLKHHLPAGSESTLDLEVLDAAAPDLKQVDVYESGASAPDVLSSLTAPLTNHGYKPDVISASLGACESVTAQALGRGGIRTVEGTLELASASGISVLASSGDQGSSACLAPDGSPAPALAVSFPASSPWVTAVGGTNVMLNAANQIVSQDVWNDAPGFPLGGGGGASTLFNRPSYQLNAYGGGRRGVPDVAMLADIRPGYEIYCSVKHECVDNAMPGPWTQVGGTSAAAPLLAGGVALVDQSLRQAGRQDVGLVNPLLYQLAQTAGQTVTSPVAIGDNDLFATATNPGVGCCSAGPGYNLAAGLGSVNIASLAAAVPALVPPLVTVGLTLPSQRRPVAAEHLLARVSCSGVCFFGAYGVVSIGRTRHPISVFSSIHSLRRPGAATIRIPFTHADLIALRAALKARRSVRATIYGVLLDPDGNIDRTTRGRRLRIRR
jgi:kumamolisin